MSAWILGIGTAVPEGRVSQERALDLALPLSFGGARKHRLISTLYRQSGVSFRHSVLLEPRGTQSFYPAAAGSEDRGPTTAMRMARYARDAGPLAIRSAHLALTGSGVSTDRITHLITVSCTGFAAPGVDVEMIQTLGLGPRTARTHVGFMGCHGAMNGLRMARAVVDADPRALVLVTAVELCTLHQQYGWDRERVVSNALFADGAASVVVGDGRDRDPLALLSMSGSTIFENSGAMMGWRVGDHGFTMNLSAGVPDAIRTNLGPWFHDFIQSAGLSIDDVGGWAIHPGGPRILTAARESLGLDEEAMAESRAVLSEFGNMSSPTVLFILERFIRARKPGPWVMLGFGPGLAAEAAVVMTGE